MSDLVPISSQPPAEIRKPPRIYRYLKKSFKRKRRKVREMHADWRRRWAQFKTTRQLGALFDKQRQYDQRIKRMLAAKKAELFSYLTWVKNQPDLEQFVLMFSGTIFIQDKRANRPIRLTRVMLEKNIAVLFSYYRYRPNEPIPGNYDKRLFQSPVDLTLDALRDIIRFDFGNKRKTFILSFPYPKAARFLNELNAHGWTTLYDIRDEWEEFHKVGQARWFDGAVEEYCVKNCHVTSAISTPLQKKLQRAAPDKVVQLCRNGYDTAFLRSGTIGERAVDKSQVLVGYFGHLTESWFDWEVLGQMADQRPNWVFEIIGHPTPRPELLRPNIHYKGFLAPPEICRLARRWRCALIPFKLGKLAEAVDPIKIYEYLALGLPTVSAPMEQIVDYPYTKLARGADEFVAAIEACLELETDPALIAAWLAENTWEKRVEELLAMARDAPPDILSALSRKGLPN